MSYSERVLFAYTPYHATMQQQNHNALKQMNRRILLSSDKNYM